MQYCFFFLMLSNYFLHDLLFRFFFFFFVQVSLKHGAPKEEKIKTQNASYLGKVVGLDVPL